MRMVQKPIDRQIDRDQRRIGTMQSHTELGGDGMATTWKTLVSSLLVVILLLGGGLVFAPTAQAREAILFPLITTETGKFTFITIMNDGFDPATTSLHFTYATKPTPIVNTAGCDHFDGDVVTTPADMMIFEVGGKVKTDPPSNVLFEGTAPVTSTALILGAANNIGFLIVEQLASNSVLGGVETVIDAATGLFWSYSTQWSTNTTADFGGIDGNNPSEGTFDLKYLSWYPSSIVTTSWYVLPLSTRAVMAPSGGGGVRLGLRTKTDHLPTPALEGAYDLDEAFFSGGRRPVVRCFGFLTRADFLQPGVLAATAGGGYTTIQSVAVTVGTDSFVSGPYTVFKLMFSTALGAPMSTLNQECDHQPKFLPTLGLTTSITVGGNGAGE
jgi:hypothetical protein